MPFTPVPTLAQVLAAGGDAGAKTIANLAGVNGFTFTNSGNVLNAPVGGGLFMHGATLAMNDGSDPGTGGGTILMEGGFIHDLALLMVSTTFPSGVGASRVIWNNASTLAVSP